MARRAWYFYGASSERHRRDMPNHLLQWEALRWALAQGCTVYDWWGAPTHPDDPEDRMQGVWQFKQGFGAELQPHIGAWDYPVSPTLYRLYTAAMPRVLGAVRRLARKSNADERGFSRIENLPIRVHPRQSAFHFPCVRCTDAPGDYPVSRVPSSMYSGSGPSLTIFTVPSTRTSRPK